MSELALELIRKEKEERTGKLDLGYCGLRELPEELFECVWLEELYLCNAYWDYEKQEWVHSENKGDYNRLSELPSLIAMLKNLKVLYANGGYTKYGIWVYYSISDISILKGLALLRALHLSFNSVSDISILKGLTQIHTLHLSSNAISDISILKGLTQIHTLHLSSNAISDISILKELTQIHTLYLSSNAISDISILKELTQLHTLILSSNNITDISILKGLTQLHTLNLGYNKQIKDFSTLKGLTQLRTLILSSNNITNISTLKGLTQLHTLDLGYNKQIKDFSTLKGLTQLRTLDISDNNITDISILKGLTQLHTLDLSFNNITDISILEKLSKLRSLDIRTNNVTDISVLEKLPQLQTLYLRFNNITDIFTLGKLPKLHTLDLHSNNITDISILEKLPQLHFLNLSDNQQIKDFSVLEKLPQLQALYFSGNEQVKDVHILEKLPQLHILDLSYNKQIEDFSILEKLPQLHTLDIRSNNITDISTLEKLPKLHTLYLRDNDITDFSILEKLPKLYTLDLSENNITELSDWIVNRRFNISVKEREYRGYLNLYDNPLENPPLEIVEQGKAAIRRYFEELEEEGAAKVYEAKMLLVGEAKVGKTSLYTKLDNKDAALPKDEERTRGIDIHRHTFKGKHGDDFIINIWDFGGQDILHATHRFFLTARSLYVLLTATDMNDDNFDYWIPNINLFGDESPILVIKNIKAGFNRNFSIRRFMDKGFHLPRQMMEVNLKTGEGFGELENAIKEHIQQLPQIGQPLPKSWVRVRKALQKEAEQQAYFSYERFQQLANQEGIEEELKVQDVGRFLHEMGVILWYQQIPALKSKVILRPEWATNAVYQIVDDSNVGTNRGYFNRKDVERVWTAESYQNMHDELLALMQAFRLCYKKRGKEEYIIPSLLPADPEALNWDADNNLTLQYQYDFMPKGIINQLTAQMHDLIRDEESVWSRGMVLKDGSTQVLITQDYYQRKLTIQCEGSDARTLMRIVMRDLDLVHEGYGGIAFKRKVPCTCSQCVTSNEPYIFEYEKLEKKLQEGKQRVPCFESEEFVNISQILYNIGFAVINRIGNIYEDVDRQVGIAGAINPLYSPAKPIDIFISYSKNDKMYLQDLQTSLKSFERKQQIKVWYDGEIEAGEEWDIKIKENLQKADIIIFLVSRDFIKTDYIWDVEIKQAMERHEKGEAVVIPLIIRPCSWTGDATPFSKLNALPSKGKAISKWEDVDEAWLNVEQGLKKVIEKELT